MGETTTAGKAARLGSQARAILIESLLVAAAGLALALAANFASPRGLSLSRNYFPPTANSPKPMAAAPHPGPSETNGVQRALGEAAERLRQRGLQPLHGQETLQLFRDPLFAQALIVFVDARDDSHYEAGHIPGAYQFDRYYPEKYLPTVLPACTIATKIVVYCTGGTCEDSEFAATTLKEAGMPADKVFVYVGGITEWTTNGWPVESGERNSGKVRGPNPP